MKGFLLWIGAGFYTSIEDYCAEVAQRGVSKRLPNEGAAKALMDPEAVVFVAHDEGERVDCSACSCEMPCLECSGSGKRKVPGSRCATCRGTGATSCMGLHEACADCAGAGHALEGCPDCAGSGRVFEGSGGVAFVDGEPQSFRRAWNASKGKGWAAKHVMDDQLPCPACGGTGWLPKGVVFGMFVPSGFEFILPAGSPPELRAEMEAKGVRVVTSEELREEAPRKCGVRIPGGVYAVTTTKATSERASEVLAALVKAGKVDPAAVEVHGDFVRFLRPVDIFGQKRFRGISRWSMPEAVRAEAEMIMDAVEGWRAYQREEGGPWTCMTSG